MIEAVLIGLAGWRLASLLVTEDGPFEIFEKIRNLIGLKTGPVEGFLPKLFSCMFCMTVWSTLLMAGTWLLLPEAVIVTAAMSIALVPELISGNQHSH